MSSFFFLGLGRVWSSSGGGLESSNCTFQNTYFGVFYSFTQYLLHAYYLT